MGSRFGVGLRCLIRESVDRMLLLGAGGYRAVASGSSPLTTSTVASKAPAWRPANVVLAAAFAARPERFPGGQPSAGAVPSEVWINKPQRPSPTEETRQ